MSENEKRQRALHQQNRSKWIRIQSIVLIALAVVMLISLFSFMRLDRRTYVYYTETGKAVHTVALNDNSFYEDQYLDANHAYISSLIDTVDAEFAYCMQMDADHTSYQYDYTLSACVHVTDKESGADIFNPVFPLKETQTGKVTDNSVSIRETVSLDYHKYNQLAREFVEAYDLKNVTATLVVTMDITLKGESASFAQESSKSNVIALNIPLLKQTVHITAETTTPREQQRILACNSPMREVFLYAAIIFGVLTAVAAACLVTYIIRTSNNHIDYARRVSRLLNNYKSYIQRITDPFCFEGYQVLHVASFPELLEIRDTMQLPVLMYENQDRTLSQFFVATPSGVLYLYDICVEGYENLKAHPSAAV